MSPLSQQRKDLWEHRFSSLGHYIRTHLNFYRVHILFFTFAPLIASGIFYASNGEHHISYIDALYNCVSAVTVCGLATIDLSSLTPWQQVILFILMCMGSPVVVSWVMVYVRREFFASKFRHVVETELARRVANKVDAPVEIHLVPWWKRATRVLTGRNLSTIPEATSSTGSTTRERELDKDKERNHAAVNRLRPEMIRRMNDAPKLINPSGYISEGHTPEIPSAGLPDPPHPLSLGTSEFEVLAEDTLQETKEEARRQLNHSSISCSEDSIDREKGKHELQGSPSKNNAPTSGQTFMPRIRQNTGEDGLPHTQTIEFALGPRPDRDQNEQGTDPLAPTEFRFPNPSSPRMRRTSLPRIGTLPHTATMPRTGTLPRTATTHTYRSMRTKHRGFGGFPMPDQIVSRVMNYFFPGLRRQLTRTLTVPRTQTIVSQRAGSVVGPDVRAVPYISFEAVVGRNSAFQQLTRDQIEELGGVEYRALTALLWIVGGYHILSQLLAFTVIAPYMSLSRWHSDFVPPAEHRPVSSTWFSLFQVVSSYTNTGMSLVDQSMVPFQTAYPMILFMVFLIFAGNTTFPIFLRFTIWIISKLVPHNSRLSETIHFLLDHPRRCFIYLFPSHQTWFLLSVVLALNLTDWFFFLVLDLGNPAVTVVPTGVRVIIGLLQAAAVRCAGFAAVSLSALAPAVKVLYVLMMYVSVYPIAMSVRSTNVYEEKSLGVFEDDDASIGEEGFTPTGHRATIWSRYLAMHMRKQLSFDMWWLGLALFLVCIVEKDNLENPDNLSWFTIFTIVFELVSAYGSVGLSLGLPYANYSFSGALRPLSKLIVCAVMLRGRHRGLPVAIDRAVMLPFEFRASDMHDEEPQDVASPRRNSQDSPYANGTHNDTGNPPFEKLQRRSWHTASPDSAQLRRPTSKDTQLDAH
ncbi:uncharacterized protein PHACADRAFT_211077 [Phanerochaete carnosa HHB-10118-sp]|uniref:Potassium transport protein n=1 Tax=Phanerochaete carnosa (strain HHB-10118-sp) TaxID=650164 RepID=K5VPL0_PHACS|nr:uncharacterized protein PHACADRAFT_211077 [Phanerochaete carnosa HHB-10118-sp]EKM53378.1 hypothetical protein PHACADRAFT_211077 [Phanerochaete carnosa HHB-10118-sp]